MEGKIDFVIAWVDGSDRAWKSEFVKWKELHTSAYEKDQNQINIDISDERYRDWDNLRYWFRAVERFTPWVNKIHFITWGHLPDWLDTSHPKLNIVNHKDYIPEEYLPTFSSCPIELNMHRIKGLSDRFVYFNDDMFICRPISPERFFRGGLPCDMARLNVIGGDRINHNALECVKIINFRYYKKKAMRKNLGKWLNYRYRASDIFKTLTLMPWSFFPGFKEHHTPQPFLKHTFERLWNEEYEALHESSKSRFRRPVDLLQWLMHYEQLASGEFAPHGYKDVILRQISDSNIHEIANTIKSQRCSMICLNDNDKITNFNSVKESLNSAFEVILPLKCSYEK